MILNQYFAQQMAKMVFEVLGKRQQTVIFSTVDKFPVVFEVICV